MKESQYIKFSQRNNIKDPDIKIITDYLERYTLKKISYDKAKNIVYLGELPIYISSEDIYVKKGNKLLISLPKKTFAYLIPSLLPVLKNGYKKSR